MSRTAIFFSVLVVATTTLLSSTAIAASCTLNSADPSITICSPAANSSVSNPVTISAGSTDSAGVIAMAIYVDNTLVSKVNGNQINTSASFSAGSHYLVVQLWDNAGRILKQPEYFTVTTSTVPTINFTANPASIAAGQSSTLSWTTTNATSVMIDNGLGSQPTSGSVVVTPSATATYTLTATGPGGTSTAKTTVTVGSAGGNCSPASPAPSVTICSPTNGSTVPSPVHVLAVPNSNNGVIAMAVYFDNSLVYKANVNQVDQYVNASTGSHYVVVQFWDNSGNVPAKASANVTVGTTNPPPTTSLSASPTSITSGQSSTLTWSTSNATSVSIDNGIGSVAASGAITVTPTATTTYTLTATGPGGTATAQATVTISSGTTPPTVSFSASPTSIIAGQSSTLTWSTSNATSVSIDNGIGNIATAGTQSVSPTRTTTYTLTATGPGGTTTAQATVTVSTSGTCTPASPAPSVTICSPTNGSTVSSPVHVVAVPNSNNGVIAMAVYFDNTLVFKQNGNTVDTYVNTTTGSHYIVVQFWDNSGSVPAKASENITVGTSSSGLVVSPSNATVLVNDTQQFTATNNGSPVLANWSIDGIQGGNTSVGTIDANGIYTAPSSAGAHQVKAVSTSNSSLSGTATVNVVNSSVAVTTYHNDAQRTGANLAETILKPSNVNASTFGKLATYSVDGQVYAQPLYVPSLTINGSAHNVLYIATEHDSVFAFDADGKTSTPLWKVSLLAAGQTTVSSTDASGIKPEIGVTSTPVIDVNNNVMYVVAYVNNSGNDEFWLHALDLHTGAERLGGPKRVTATVSGTGSDSVNGQITLSGACYQRSGLALGNGNVYLAFAHCNHGWVLAYNAGTLAQTAVYNTTPNGAGGTIWMGGGAPAFDASGNVYVMTGTNFGATADSGYNDAFMRFTPSLGLADYFMPSDNATLVANDVDLGAGGPLVLPDNSSSHPHEIVGAGKDGRIFLIDRDNMGKFDPNANHVIQAIQSGTQQWNNFHDTPAYWNGNLYYHSNADVLRQFKWSNGLLSTSPFAVGPDVFNAHGATPSVSANGNSNGIVWELKLDGQPSSPAILYAYDAMNVANVLYKSSTNPADTAPNAVKFTVPTIVNGKVYVAGGGQVAIYGLK